MAYIPHGVIITTESDKSLKGNFSILNQADPFPVSPGVTVRMVYAAQDIPIPNIPWNAAHELKGIANDNGVSFIELELAAHTQTAMHSTQSVDLGVIITGEVVLTLDTGEERVLKAGDLIVQRGATHRWENRTGSSARVLSVIIAARGPTGQ